MSALRCVHDLPITEACEACQKTHNDYRTRTVEVVLPQPPPFIRIEISELVFADPDSEKT